MSKEFEFPESFEPERSEGPGDLPPQIAAIVGHMLGRDERPDTRELEWANVLIKMDAITWVHDMAVSGASQIRACLDRGYALHQKLKIKDGFIYWQGARLKKPEGE